MAGKMIPSENNKPESSTDEGDRFFTDDVSKARSARFQGFSNDHPQNPRYPATKEKHEKLKGRRSRRLAGGLTFGVGVLITSILSLWAFSDGQYSTATIVAVLGVTASAGFGLLVTFSLWVVTGKLVAIKVISLAVLLGCIVFSESVYGVAEKQIHRLVGTDEEKQLRQIESLREKQLSEQVRLIQKKKELDNRYNAQVEIARKAIQEFNSLKNKNAVEIENFKRKKAELLRQIMIAQGENSAARERCKKDILLLDHKIEEMRVQRTALRDSDGNIQDEITLKLLRESVLGPKDEDLAAELGISKETEDELFQKALRTLEEES